MRARDRISEVLRFVAIGGMATVLALLAAPVVSAAGVRQEAPPAAAFAQVDPVEEPAPAVAPEDPAPAPAEVPAPAEAPAEEAPLFVYRARIGEGDHFNSRGVRLPNAAQVVQQDRANYHIRGIRDPEDESDPQFADRSQRRRLGQILATGIAESDAEQIMEGTPLIEVRVFPDRAEVSVVPPGGGAVKTEIRREEPLFVYRARIGAGDHFNSRGVRLPDAAQVVQQDRANYHIRGIRDPEDEFDPRFAERAARRTLPALLSTGISAEDARKIMRGKPLVEVRVFADRAEARVIAE